MNTTLRKLILFSGAVLSLFSTSALANYCESKGSNSYYEWIEAISINADNFISGSNGGYKQHTDPMAVMKTGGNLLSVQPGYSGYAYHENWAGWIDLNKDNSFTEDEKVFQFSGNTAQQLDVFIPEGVEGFTTLRIVMKWGSSPSACGSYTYGETEDFVVFIEGDGAEPAPPPYHLSMDYDFTVHRDGNIGDALTWVVEKDGAIVLKRNAKSELEFKYWNNTYGSDFRIWLEQYISGSYQTVSNVVEYTPGITNLHKLSVGEGYELSRTGSYGDSVQWVIEQDGKIVLERNASNEMAYTYFGNTKGSNYRAWLKQFINGEYKIVSNTVEYEVGQQEFTLAVDQMFGLTRNGTLGDPVQWVIEKDGVVVLERNAADELEYTYYNNTPGSSFRVWLKMYIDGEYQTVSNVVEYDVPASYPYTVTLGSNYQVTRSGSLGDNVQWVIIKNGSVVLQRYAGNELSYTYYSNTAGSVIQIYLQQFINGYYQPVSNTVQYTVQ